MFINVLLMFLILAFIWLLFKILINNKPAKDGTDVDTDGFGGFWGGGTDGGGGDGGGCGGGGD